MDSAQIPACCDAGITAPGCRLSIYPIEVRPTQRPGDLSCGPGDTFMQGAQVADDSKACLADLLQACGHHLYYKHNALCTAHFRVALEATAPPPPTPRPPPPLCSRGSPSRPAAAWNPPEQLLTEGLLSHPGPRRDRGVRHQGPLPRPARQGLAGAPATTPSAALRPPASSATAHWPTRLISTRTVSTRPRRAGGCGPRWRSAARCSTPSGP